ncbi:MAG: carboxypeptidase regulatory-like domain-containing protein [Bosea sp.]|uniref:carboxypeptidase-like regulatory domain-containing protein n=1 Tax=Bosea sp. (in: a-proteobacteria) TaxID=1871050 RepID=UPI00238FE67B|nr:carboxypeptidase regulatory-like domain-containing protein [Bosea sp. (in: a-proteobacteria)]MCP4733337.1 carboxypeptidase regulatory-like domain-containing protein [Bosea sp. (in: a-proteobacteria)]
MNSRKWLRAGLCSLALLAPPLQAAELRRLPYPFGQVISFASDIDFQTPWHGRAIHRFLNEELGLPISDSLWVASTGGGADTSAFFGSFQRLNDNPSRVDGHPTFGLLLREWHRGNIDHLHSWTDDLVPQYRYMLPQPQPLQAEATNSTPLSAAPWVSAFAGADKPGARGYQQFRLLFDRPPPADLSVEIERADGTRLRFSSELAGRFRTTGDGTLKIPATVSLILNETWPVGVARDERPSFSPLTAVRIWAPSCASSCTANLLGFENDNFSRWSVLRQKSFLTFFNIRPSLVTPHGGLTYHPNFEGPGKHYERTLNMGAVGNDLVRTESPGLAGRTGSHGYYADILRELGVRQVMSIWNGGASEWGALSGMAPPMSSLHQGFYAASRTNMSFGTIDEPPETSQARLVALEPAAAGFDISPYVCTTDLYCRGGEQGSTVGGLIAFGRDLIGKGISIEHHWYTHFGTTRADPTIRTTSETPFSGATMDAFRKLADDYYDRSGTLPEKRRVWTPPSAVWSNYRLMREKLAGHVSVDAATSTVKIASFFDDVLKQQLPQPQTGSRDLHGITVYVPDARRASVLLDGIPLASFTRNPADASGRESITLVDDNTPTTIFHRLPPTASGTVDVEDANYEWQAGDRPDAPPGYVRLTARRPIATLTLAPRDLKLWNTTHLGWSYRIYRPDGAQAVARLALTFTMQNGARVGIAEGAPGLPPGVDAGRTIPPHQDQNWQNITVAQHDFKWTDTAQHRRILPLAIGPVAAIEIRLDGAQEGDVLEIGSLQALRPSANGIAQDDSLLAAGRVLGARGMQEQAVQVTAQLQDGTVKATATDRFGYYAFSAVPKGSILRISATGSSGPCAPARGHFVEIRKNEAEIDIDLAECGR